MKSDWLTGKDLIERWSIKDFELLQYVKNGLQPYYKGRAGLQPQLPPGVVTLQTEMKTLQDEADEYEKLFANFSGTAIEIEDWRRLPVKSRAQEIPGAIYYSDGSTDWIRESAANQKASLRIYEDELAKYPDLPSWKNYNEHDEYSHNFDGTILSLLNSHFMLEDVEAIEERSSKDHPQRH